MRLALATLSGNHQAMLSLHYLEGLSVAELAAAFAIPEDPDEKIRRALQGSGVEPMGYEREETLRAQVLETFRGQLRWITIGVWVEQFLFLGLAIFAAVRFFQAEATRDLVFWATVFLTCFWLSALMKVWFWMLLNRNAVIREVKRLELQVANLAARTPGRQLDEPTQTGEKEERQGRELFVPVGTRWERRHLAGQGDASPPCLPSRSDALGAPASCRLRGRQPASLAVTGKKSRFMCEIQRARDVYIRVGPGE